jgi:phosphatidate cytidylyltransferase
VLRWRLVSAAVILAILFSLLYADFNYNFGHPGIWLAPLLILLSLMGAGECLDLMSARDLKPVAWSVYTGVFLVSVAACAPIAWVDYPMDCPLGELGWPLAAMAFSVVLTLVAEMRRYREPGESILGAALGTFVIGYTGLLVGFLAFLRMFHSNEWGMVALISTVLVTKITDTGAYTFGRLFGRTKMAPVLSPGKTVEGAVGGIVTACLTSYLFFQFAVPQIIADAKVPWYAPLIYGVVVAVAGMVGDLAESLFKRDMGRKDSSSWLPGLGGILDIIDSILVAGPAAFACWVLGLFAI